MKKSMKIMALLGVLLLLTGCLSVNVEVEERFERTVDIPKYNKAAEVPYEYTVFGSCSVKGNYQDFSLDDLYRKALIEGEEVGADAIIIKSIRVMPQGRAVAFNPTLNIIGATDGANNQNWEDINKDFDGGYGSIRNKNIATTVNYDRTVVAEFIKFKRNDQGDLIKNTSETTTNQ